MKASTIIIGILCGMIIIIISLLILEYGELTTNNVGEIEGHPCANNHRIGIGYPFCSDLQSCMDDCYLVQGEFIKLRYQSEGIGNQHLCYCLTERGIENIW